MKTACQMFAVITLAIFAAATQAAEEPAGYGMPLFDGQSLSGWNVEGGCKVVVDDGTILLKEGDGWLRSDLQYSDFVLHVEWRALKPSAYDAGVYIRTANAGSPFPKPSYQCNLLEGKEGNIGNLPGAESTGLVKPGEWNSFDITVVGDTVQMDINGRKAYRVSGLAQATGYVGLQCEVPKGGQFRFRNLRITELGFRGLLDDSLSAWTGAGAAADTCWKITDGVLQCTGQKGPWLRSRREYDDFNLRFEYQVSPGGNSGVYVRVPENGNHHRASSEQPPAGFEVQLLDDDAPKHKNLKPYQYTGSVYDIAPAEQHVSKPAGTWNTLEIDCRGQRVRVQHNGVPIVDCDPERFELIKLRQTAGYLGLQNHSTVVLFRYLRVGPPQP